MGMAQDTIPDIIIIDDCLPQIDGTELCRTLKGAQLTNHVYLITVIGEP